MFKKTMTSIAALSLLPWSVSAEHLRDCVSQEFDLQDIARYASINDRICLLGHTDFIEEDSRFAIIAENIEVICREKFGYPEGTIFEGQVYLEASSADNIDLHNRGLSLVMQRCDLYSGGHQ
ncbi:MAG: hypothetical protein AAF346_04870 [Pseudomonadota bacterium]